MIPDHYAVLGVSPEADSATIRAAYLRLMRRNHPDLRPGDPSAAAAARRANAAWETLRDSDRRRRYDALRARRLSDPTTSVLAVQGPARVETLRAAAAANAAYSPSGADYRRAFHRTCLRVGLAVLAFGTLMLLALS